MKRPISSFIATAALIATAFGQGTLLWDESVNGPLSNDPFAPTSLGPMQLSTNSLTGAVQFVPAGGGPGGTLFSDHVTFTIANGHFSTKLWLTADTTVSVWLGDVSFSQPLGSIINPANGELFAQLGLLDIPSGNYGLYIADRNFAPSPTVANYRLDFFVQAPEPSTIALALLGVGLFALRFRKTRNRPQ